jgi:hypothetical protein
MFDYAKTIVFGRLTKDVEVRTYKKNDGSGTFSKLVFTVAVNSFYKKEKHTEYYLCVAGENFVKLEDGSPHPGTTMKKGQNVRVELVKRERSYKEHVSDKVLGDLYLPPLPGETANRPVEVTRYITEFHVHELGIQPKSWSEGASGQVYAQAAPTNAPATNVVMGTVGSAPPPAMPAASPSAAAEAAANFAASNSGGPDL